MIHSSSKKFILIGIIYETRYNCFLANGIKDEFHLFKSVLYVQYRALTLYDILYTIYEIHSWWFIKKVKTGSLVPQGIFPKMIQPLILINSPEFHVSLKNFQTEGHSVSK